MNMAIKSNMKMPKGLGKGLSALIGDGGGMEEVAAPAVSSGAAGGETNVLPLSKIQPGNYQPRHYFDEERLRELADSVRENGVLQPIIVRKLAEDSYQIIAGERRWRASKLVGLASIPVIIKELSDKEALELALIENVQRQDLTPLEEALGYQRLIQEFSYTQETLADIIGKSRSHVTNLLRLLGLPEEIKALVNDGSLSMGHARALINVPHAVDLAKQVQKQGLSVRQTEKLVKKGAAEISTPPANNSSAPAKSKKPAKKDEDIIVLEKALSENIGLKVSIEDDDKGGRVVIAFENLQQLDRILKKLGGGI